MFEEVIIRRQRLLNSKEPLNAGFLAEALLFYQHVHLFVEKDALSNLTRVCGADIVMRLINEGYLKVNYIREAIGIKNTNVGTSNEVHKPVSANDSNGQWELDVLAPSLFSSYAGGSGWGRQMGREFANIVPTIDIRTCIDQVRADFLDAHYVFEAVKQILAVLAPTYTLPLDYFFRLTPKGTDFAIETNIDFTKVNIGFNVLMGTSGENITGSMLLIYIFDARLDLFLASQYGSEIATHEINSRIISEKTKDVISKRQFSSQEIYNFQKMVLADGNDIADAINMSYCTWTQFIELLEKSRKFKHWLKDKDADASLVREYFKEVTTSTWVELLPSKILRFAIVSTIGIAAPPIAGFITSALDSFLLDKMGQGWRPHIFIDDSVKKFLRLD